MDLVSFTHDSTLLASASSIQLGESKKWKSTIRMWDVFSGECVQTINGDGSYPSLDFSYDSAMMVSTVDRSVSMWQRNRSEHKNGWYCHKMLLGHEELVCAVRFAPDASLIGSCSRDGSTRVWRTDTGDCIHVFQGPTVNPAPPIFHPNCLWVIACSPDRCICIWSMDSGECLRRFKWHTGIWNHLQLALSPDGNCLLVANQESLRIWDLNTGEPIQDFSGHGKEITSLSFLQNSDQFVSASEDQTMRIWQIDKSGRGQNMKQIDDDSEIVSIEFSQGSLVMFTRDYKVYVDTGDDMKYFSAPEPRDCFFAAPAVSHNSKSIAVIDENRVVYIWDWGKNNISRRALAKDSVLGSKATHAWFSRDLSLCAEVGPSGFVRIWDIESCTCLKKIAQPPNQSKSVDVCSTVFSSALDLIAVVYNHCLIQVWDRTTDEILEHYIEPGKSWINSAIYLSSSSQLALLYDDELRIVASRTRAVQDFPLPSSRDFNKALCWSEEHQVLTVFGTIQLKTSGLATRSDVPNPTRAAWVGLGVSNDFKWLTWDGYNLLRLPVKLHGKNTKGGNRASISVQTNTVAILYNLNRYITVGLCPENMGVFI